MHKESVINALKKYNKYDLSGEYGIGWTTNTNHVFYFDLEDYEKIKDYCWIENDQGYIIAHNIHGTQPVNVRMHRIVTNQEFDIVDHRNTKRYDNRKMNLRTATKQTNGINRGVNANNKVGTKGTFFNSNTNKYQSKIQKGNRVYSKSSNNIDELKSWREEKERELYGEYAYQGGDK